VLEKTTRLFSEGLARAMDRRDFVKRAGSTVFAGIAALAAGQAMPQLALAGAAPGASAGRPNPVVPSCAPPGPYCNLNGVNEPNGCHGGSCFQHLNGGTVQQCRVYYAFYQAGCWTTAASGGYWTCCDCQCTNGSTCGCAQFNGSPIPRPDGIGQ
jgi:hypothetical protein